MKSIFSKLSAKRAQLAVAYQSMSDKRKQVFHAALLSIFLMSPQLSFAASSDGSELLCYIAQYFKQIAGAAALVVITLWAIEHFFGVAKLHDVVIKVGISAGVIIMGSVLVAKSGLTVNCVW